jgi:DUF1680 family protein
LYNEGGYAETCAAIGLVFWAHRLLKVDLDGRYGDMMERALYNGVLSGVSLDGKKFFYENPLASMGTHRRQDWFGCSCCPPNVARLLASLGEYVYSTDEKGLVVHLYGASKAEMAVGGRQVSLTQQTAYPWDGKVGLTFGMKGSADFTLKLRLPGWCRKYSLKVNGAKAAAKLEKGYLAVKRAWRNSDRVELNLEMPVERVYAHPKLRFDCGRVALARGPVVYCLEAADNGGDLNALALARKAPINRRWEPGLLGGVVTLEFSMEAMKQADWKGTLYRAASPSAARKKVKAIPYCVWENRKPGEMLVWMREVIQ